MDPTPGRIVLYTLREGDVQLINEQRAASARAGLRVVANEVAAGQVYAATVSRVFDGATGGECNLTVQLDGPDTFWACSRKRSDAPAEGMWHWPVRG